MKALQQFIAEIEVHRKREEILKVTQWAFATSQQPFQVVRLLEPVMTHRPIKSSI